MKSKYKMARQQPYIMLIDNDPDDLEMLSIALDEIGVRVKSFESSSNALIYLDLVSENKDLPSLIIMDFNMPKKNGYDVLLLLKNNPGTSGIPVLIYSSTIDPLLKVKLMNAGAAGCFNKSGNSRELTGLVKIFEGQFMEFQET